MLSEGLVVFLYLCLSTYCLDPGKLLLTIVSDLNPWIAAILKEGGSH